MSSPIPPASQTPTPICKQSVSDSIILDSAFPSWWQLNCKAMTLRFQYIYRVFN